MAVLARAAGLLFFASGFVTGDIAEAKGFIMGAIIMFHIVMTMEANIVVKQVNALIEGGYYPNKAEFVEDAISAFFELRKDMKIASVIELYKKEEISISKAAELAGLDMEEIKRVLVEEGVGIKRGFTKDRRTAASELSGMV
ncbi:hypothetical protein DRO03_00495 [Methanosarcinales archaeon]|nr:MAG: hypothetical protein DRO03_00495 [Methanosarcinales archaeon]